MTPTANALLFLAVAVLLFGLSRGMPRVVTFKRCLAVLIFLGCLDLLLLVRSLHSMAAVLLALGLAKFGSDLLCSASKANAIRVLRWLVGLRTTSSATEGSVEGTPPELSVDRRRVLWAAAAAIGAPALGISAWNWDEERRQLARIPEVGAGRPNVLLLVLDTVRAANLSLYGYERPTTPHLDRLAGGATCFEWAIAGAPWTLPSHAVMFTGQHAHLLNCGFETPLNQDHPTLAEMLAARGYATAGFVANTQYCARNWGVGRGFVHYEDMPYTLERLGMSSNLIRSVLTADRFRRWTGTHDYYALRCRGNQPAFAALGRPESAHSFFCLRELL